MVFEKMRKIIAEQFMLEENEITEATSFESDLNADSLDIVELTMAMEEEFDLPEVPEEELTSIRTVGDLVEYVKRFLQED